MPSKGLGIGALGFGQLGGATPPHGNVKAISYSPKIVRFPSAAYLLKASSSIVGSNLLTANALFRINSGSFTVPDFRGLAIPIIQFGPQLSDFAWKNDPAFASAPISPITGGISVAFFDTVGPGQLQISASSAQNSITGRANYAGSTAPGTGWIYTYQHGAGTVQLDKLVQIFVSLRIKPSAATFNGFQPGGPHYTATSWCDCNIVIDGVDVSPDLLDGYNIEAGTFVPSNVDNNQNRATFGLTTVYNGSGDAFIGNPGTTTQDFDYPAGQTIPQFNIGTVSLPIGIPSDNGQTVQAAAYYYPAGVSTPAVEMADLQVWLGTYIDPTGSYGGATTAKPTQANSQYGKVDPVLLGQVAQAAVAAGLDPLYVLTAMNIESAYGTQPGINSSNPAAPNGIFQLNAEHLNDALGTNFTTAAQVQDNNNQMRAFVASNIAYANNAIPSYMDVSILYIGSDPTGVYSYIGQLGSVNQVNTLSALSSAPSTLIKNLPAPTNTAILNQAWTTGIDGNSTVAAWFSALNSLWTTARADAASRLQGTSNANINAFYSQAGTPVPPIVAASLFGEPTLLFTGNASEFPVNTGDTEATEIFSLINGPLTNFTPGS